MDRVRAVTQVRRAELDVDLVLARHGFCEFKISLTRGVVSGNDKRRGHRLAVQVVLVAVPHRRHPIRAVQPAARCADAKVLNSSRDLSLIVKHVLQPVTSANRKVDNLLHHGASLARIVHVEHRGGDDVIHR